MSFGIGTNTEKANSGFVKGEHHEIACECWFTCSGKTTPIMIKIEDEDGEIRTIRQIQVHSQEKKQYAGIPSEEYDCTIVILGQQVPVRLIHYLTESKWVLNFR